MAEEEHEADTGLEVQENPFFAALEEIQMQETGGASAINLDADGATD